MLTGAKREELKHDDPGNYLRMAHKGYFRVHEESAQTPRETSEQKHLLLLSRRELSTKIKGGIFRFFLPITEPVTDVQGTELIIYKCESAQIILYNSGTTVHMKTSNSLLSNS